MRLVGAEPGLAPEPATDEELEWLHSRRYLAVVKRFSADPFGDPEAGIGRGDDPPFAGMHEAAATVAGGSIRGIEAIIRGDTEHAYQPGGGLHHAMRDRASGFCVYNDVALAIARARRAGLRVLYVDLDVHHGDGVQAFHYADPGVLTVSFHESGRSLFPGSGFVDELGEGSAAATSVNVPLEPYAGPDVWLAAIRRIVPPLAAAFGPDIVVSQHGCDGHAWDPLAHLCLTTTAMGRAARLVDSLAHRYAGGRWFATGGGGYSVYRVVPRVWAMTWLAGAHLEVPDKLPREWLDRWQSESAAWGEAPLPAQFEDAPEVARDGAGRRAAGRVRGSDEPAGGEEHLLGTLAKDQRTVELVEALTVPALLRVAQRRGWWGFESDRPRTSDDPDHPGGAGPTAGSPTIALLEPDLLRRLPLAPRTIAPADPAEARSILSTAIADGSIAIGAIDGEWLVGVALAVGGDVDGVDELVALGVAPEWRGRGLGGELLRRLLDECGKRSHALVAVHTAAERDPFDPLPRAARRGVAEHLLRSAGFHFVPDRIARSGEAAAAMGATDRVIRVSIADSALAAISAAGPSLGAIAAADPAAFAAIHLAPGAGSRGLDLV